MAGRKLCAPNLVRHSYPRSKTEGTSWLRAESAKSGFRRTLRSTSEISSSRYRKWHRIYYRRILQSIWLCLRRVHDHFVIGSFNLGTTAKLGTGSASRSVAELPERCSGCTTCRHIPLPDDVFTDQSLRCRVTGNCLQATWQRARAGVGRTDLRLHDLRHTGLTLAAATGATTTELMHGAGHSSAVAAMRYQHATRYRDRVLAEALGELAKPTVR